MILSAIFVFSWILSCTPPKRDYTVAQIQSVNDFAELMWVMATVADPRFGIAKSTKPEELAPELFDQFTDMGQRIHATAQRLPAFSKGKEYDEIVQRLSQKAQELESFSKEKKAKETLDSTLGILDQCKACHKKYR